MQGGLLPNGTYLTKWLKRSADKGVADAISLVETPRARGAYAPLLSVGADRVSFVQPRHIGHAMARCLRTCVTTEVVSGVCVRMTHRQRKEMTDVE